MRYTTNLHLKNIRLKNINEYITLCFFSDVHRDSTLCCEERWKRYLEECKKRIKQNPNTFFIGVGDYFDFLSTSERKKINKDEVHETTMDRFDMMIQREVRNFAKEISFIS